MTGSAREEILGKLRQAPRREPEARPLMPPLSERSLDREGMIKKFSDALFFQTATVRRVKDNGEALDTLTEIAREEALHCVMASTDDVVTALDLPGWAREQGITLRTPLDFADRDAFKESVFTEAGAGITGVDFAVAETGTLGLIHDRNQARLISLAPIFHIAIVPVDRFVPVYEDAIEKVFADPARMPGQFTFITGPSMTADIQATPFRGMHGPRRLTVIIVG